VRGKLRRSLGRPVGQAIALKISSRSPIKASATASAAPKSTPTWRASPVSLSVFSLSAEISPLPHSYLTGLGQVASLFNDAAHKSKMRLVATGIIPFAEQLTSLLCQTEGAAPVGSDGATTGVSYS